MISAPGPPARPACGAWCQLQRGTSGGRTLTDTATRCAQSSSACLGLRSYTCYTHQASQLSDVPYPPLLTLMLAIRLDLGHAHHMKVTPSASAPSTASAKSQIAPSRRPRQRHEHVAVHVRAKGGPTSDIGRVSRRHRRSRSAWRGRTLARGTKQARSNRAPSCTSAHMSGLVRSWPRGCRRSAPAS